MSEGSAGIDAGSHLNDIDVSESQTILDSYLEDVALVIDRYADLRRRSAAIGKARQLDTNRRPFVPVQRRDSIGIGS